MVAATVAIAGAVTAPAAPAGTVREPTNLGQVKNDVRNYYGAYRDDEGHYHHSDTSQWGTDVEHRIAEAKSYLANRLSEGVRNPAIVLDIDDTAETTFGPSADNDFGFDPVKNDQAILAGVFPAISRTRDFANWAAQQNVRVYFVTGRKPAQSEASLKHLADEGYPTPAEAYFKPTTTAPDYLPCGLTCPTADYKAYTRAHIESEGATIVVNIGDQDSDLQHGHAERQIKLPNPMYYLP